ncbi:hypothetical protein EES43_00235 [Streptomyces sp. ADI96-02]|uniref:hypothetical protein n=1 Tax=Streptomyces sp. ADI96-02 TaxID=1522760 RepID=UPI000F551E9B|nr:hypothetical protein [Streptomyces sp. ADI96-02]RPK69230.1 hypothetical protein EES43_00235 [Streptomyces sp. ADI96-02]
MRQFRSQRSASPATGVLRGMRVGGLAALCVLLPLVGHVLTRGHAPRWVLVAAMAVVALPGAAVLTRRRLTDTQLLIALAATQAAYHAAYSLPGACATVGAPGLDPTAWIEHGAPAGPPAGVLLAGHLVTILLTARLLGLTERLLWRSKPLLRAVLRVLRFIRPLLNRAHGSGPRAALPEAPSHVKPAVLALLHEGRAPPRRGGTSFVLLRPTPTGGPCLP